MKYQVFKLSFRTAVHFGTGGLTTTANTFKADTLFSALCLEAVKCGDDPNRLVEAVRTGVIRLSDGLPFIDERLYVPKPLINIEIERQGDSSIKKSLKNLAYVPVDALPEYLTGSFDVSEEEKRFAEAFGKETLIEKAAISGHSQVRPYAVSVFRYGINSGLYIIFGYASDEAYFMVSDLLNSLSYSGIGGERSSGYGRFEISMAKTPEPLYTRLCDDSFKRYMSLSMCLPSETELDAVLDDAQYLLVKRSGWRTPLNGGEAIRKRRDIYMLAAGSVFKKTFLGDIYNLSEGDGRAVYRYGYPMFMGVS